MSAGRALAVCAQSRGAAVSLHTGRARDAGVCEGHETFKFFVADGPAVLCPCSVCVCVCVCAQHVPLYVVNTLMFSIPSCETPPAAKPADGPSCHDLT